MSSTWSLDVCDELGVDARGRRDAEFAALLHDVGKIRIPSEIINKPGKLDAEERAIIETHTVIGEELLRKVGGVLSDVGTIVRSCHERWDGARLSRRALRRGDPAGGPDRVHVRRLQRDDDRPVVPRRSCPPTRRSRSYERCAGTQFDPRVVDALVVVASR